MKINIKKTLAAILALCAMTSGAVIPSAGTSLLAPKAVTASAATQTVNKGDFTYSYCYDSNYGGYVAAVNKYSGTSSKPSIPASIKIGSITYKVFAIEKNAFARNNSITEITIPEGCIMIGEGAFRECKNLKKVNFSSTLNTIYLGAFYMCSSLEELSNVRIDGNYNFQPRAFYGCTNLKKINGSKEVWRSNNDVYLTHENLVKKCFSADETVGFIQEYVNGKADAVVAQIRAAHPGCTQLLLAKLLRDWVIDHGVSAQTKWMSEHPNQMYTDAIRKQEENRAEYHDDTAIFFGGVGVCEGYSKALRKLYLAAGFNCELSRGKAISYDNNGNPSEEYHIWNVVNLDGAWYNVDVYWDDLNPSAPTTNWYLLSDEEIKNRESRTNHSYSGLYHDRIAIWTNGPFYGNKADDLFLYSCYYSVGDVNKDGCVTREDADQLGVGLNYGGKISTVNSDMNYDGAVTLEDLFILRSIVGY